MKSGSPTSCSPLVTLDAIQLHRGEELVIQELSLTLHQGECYALLGPSGCGKSSLLRALCGLLPPTAGRLTFSPNLQIALLPQHYGLLPWKTVEENVALGCHLHQQSPQPTIKQALEAVKMSAYAHRFPHSLSGGQQQRVAIARALTLRPQLLLMDEPFSALDPMHKEQVQALLVSLGERYAFSTLFVTHHIEEAVTLAQHIGILTPSPASLSAWIPNPQGGSPGFSLTPLFSQQCQKVRQALYAVL